MASVRPVGGGNRFNLYEREDGKSRKGRSKRPSPTVSVEDKVPLIMDSEGRLKEASEDLPGDNHPNLQADNLNAIKKVILGKIQTTEICKL